MVEWEFSESLYYGNQFFSPNASQLFCCTRCCWYPRWFPAHLGSRKKFQVMHLNPKWTLFLLSESLLCVINIFVYQIFVLCIDKGGSVRCHCTLPYRPIPVTYCDRNSNIVKNYISLPSSRVWACFCGITMLMSGKQIYFPANTTSLYPKFDEIKALRQ